MKYKDYKIGEEFEHDGIKLIVEEATDCCEGCFFRRYAVSCIPNILNCIYIYREDNKNVIAKKVE